MNNKYRIYAFSIYAIILLIFLFKIIYDQNNIFNEGRAYNFECIPVDPNDPFRGKYVQLSFPEIRTDFDSNTLPNAKFYGIIKVDENGLATIVKVDTIAPDIDNFLELHPNNISELDSQLVFTLPFDRLYMNEDKAPLAEQIYREQLLAGNETVYAKVYVSKGRYLLDDVYVGNEKLRELLDP